jgi:hypothetical protein
MALKCFGRQAARLQGPDADAMSLLALLPAPLAAALRPLTAELDGAVLEEIALDEGRPVFIRLSDGSSFEVSGVHVSMADALAALKAGKAAAEPAHAKGAAHSAQNIGSGGGTGGEQWAGKRSSGSSGVGHGKGMGRTMMY